MVEQEPTHGVVIYEPRDHVVGDQDASRGEQVDGQWADLIRGLLEAT